MGFYTVFTASLDTFEPDSASIAANIKYHAESHHHSLQNCRKRSRFANHKLECHIWVLWEDECKAGILSVYGVPTGSVLLVFWWPQLLKTNAAMLVWFFTCSADDLLCTVFFILQGRALLNAIGNLELWGAYADALRKLEDVAAGQVRYFL